MFTPVRRTILGLIACTGVFCLDQVTKVFFFDQATSFSFFGGWVQSTLHQNYGIAFNIPIPQWVILGVTLAACVGIIIAFVRTCKRDSYWLAVFLGVLLGGALGNAVDRGALGFVRDWLLLWHRSAINIADIGVLLGLLGSVLTVQKTPPSRQAD